MNHQKRGRMRRKNQLENWKEEDDKMQGGACGHEETRECAREETIDDFITKAAGHTCFTS